jgi:iron(III) transport system ATP-binding protein
VRVVVRGLHKTFRSGRGHAVKAVDDLSIEVDDRELLVILGPSGSGKTTLLRCIAGLERADSGEITVDGRLVYSSERNVWVPPERRGISMVFQSYALWPHLTTFDNVAYPLRARRASAGVIRERVASALKLVGCAGLESRHPSELSGGQQQRVAVARAVVGGSRVVLFDEPLSSVDARVREELRHELVTLQEELGFSAVYITHDQTEAMAIGHRVAVLADGRIEQIAPPRELYDEPASSYVAEFVGVSNRFDGVVESTEGQRITVRTEIGPMISARAAAGFAPGARTTLVFRPEHCRIALAAGAPQDLNAWQVTVADSLFLGYWTEYRVRVGASTLLVRTSDRVPMENGSTAWLTVDPLSVLAVAAS